MQWHSAPTKTLEQKMMLGEEVGKPPVADDMRPNSRRPASAHPQGARGFLLKRTNRRSYLTAPPVMPAMKRSRKKL
jgi:hypothetical protein